MKQIVKIFTLLGLNFLTVSASFDKDITNIAVEIADNLKLSPGKPLYITTLPLDEEYMLPMDPIFDRLEKALKPKVSEIRFRSLQGTEEKTIIGIIRGGNSLRTDEVAIDSIIMTGSYFISDQPRDRINCVLRIQDIRAQKLYKSEEFVIDSLDSPPQLQREVFSQLHDDESFGIISYGGRIIKQLENLFNTQNNNLLVPPSTYVFENRNPYAINYQVNTVKKILTLKYGISFLEDSANNTSNKVIVQADGTLIFVRDGKTWELQKIISSNSLFKNEFSSQCDSYIYLRPSINGSGEYKKPETRKIVKPEEIKFRDQIVETFNNYYPKLFNPFNYDALNKIFVDTKEPPILIGKRISSNPKTGKEDVQYTWMTKNKWLYNFKQLHDTAGLSFDVRTHVMNIFKDDLNSNRYWAIVRQNWKTKDINGVTVYQDDGFLFVNFDFTADWVLKDFKVYYRLWFYEYQFDDIELGIKRYEKLERDITTYFKNGIKSVSGSLKNVMCSYLIGQIRKSGDGVRIR